MAWRWQFHIDLRFWKVGMSIGWFGERHRDPSPPWQPEGICAYWYMLTVGTPSM